MFFALAFSHDLLALGRPCGDVGVFVCRKRYDGKLEESDLHDRPVNAAVFSGVHVFFEDLKSEAALADVASFDSGVRVHRVRIFRIDLNASPDALVVYSDLRCSCRRSSEDEPRVVIDENSYIVSERVVKSASVDALAHARPDFINAIKNDEVTLYDRIPVVVPGPRDFEVARSFQILFCPFIHRFSSCYSSPLGSSFA